MFRRKRPYDDIDPAIRPLVERMNGTGAIKTIASCQGHTLRWMAPYVYFHAPVEVAAAIDRQLRELCYRDDPYLHFFWVITGHFNENHELVFSLESPEQGKRTGRLLDQITPIGFINRRRLDADFLALATLIERVIANLPGYMRASGQRYPNRTFLSEEEATGQLDADNIATTDTAKLAPCGLCAPR